VFGFTIYSNAYTVAMFLSGGQYQYLLPFSCQAIARQIIKRSEDKVKAGITVQMGGFEAGASSHTAQKDDSNVVEGEFTEVLSSFYRF